MRGRSFGVRTRGVRLPPFLLDRRLMRPRGTGEVVTPQSPLATRYAKNPEIDDRRLAIVRVDNPDPPSDMRTTLELTRGIRCEATKSTMSRLVISKGSL
jgi:hypothetical protein